MFTTRSDGRVERYLCTFDSIKMKPTYRHNIHIIKMLISNDNEKNPGPQLDSVDKKHLHVCTYNIQGLREFKKLKRFMNFVHKQKFNKNAVINLQETHIVNTDTLKYQWKGEIIQSPGASNSRGVAILFNKEQFDEVISKRKDNEGRFCSFTASKNGRILCFMNVYAPNNHYDSLKFFRTLEEHMLRELDDNSGVSFVISGDLNFVFDSEVDAIGRKTSPQEKKVVEFVKSLMTKFNIIDSYRTMHNWGGYTWGRNNPSYLRSRLDHVLVSALLKENLVQSYSTTTPNESDHSFVYTEIDLGEMDFGPGIKRCNAKLLDDQDILNRVICDLEEKMRQLPNTWNAHQRIDYAKMVVMEIMLNEGKERARAQKK